MGEQFGRAANGVLLTIEQVCGRVIVLIHDWQEMRVVAAAVGFPVGGRGKSRLAQAEMLGVFVPGANQGSEARASLTAWKGLSLRPEYAESATET